MILLVVGLLSAWQTAALEELNRLRMENGSPPVRLLITGLAERKARNLLAWGVFSHYSPEGYSPLLDWTRVWGKDAFEENLYVLWSEGTPGVILLDGGVERYVREGVRMMVERDALSFWHHRRSLLDPCHTHVDVGMATGRDTFFLAVYMITSRVRWTLRPSWRFPEFSMAGRLDDALHPDSLRMIILRDRPDPRNTKRASYNPGQPYAGVVPTGSGLRYPGIPSLEATRWRVKGQDVDIRFNWEPEKPGVYTVQVDAALRTPLPYSPRPGEQEIKRRCTILLYSVEKGGYR